jgi:predicted esterase
MLFNIVVGIVMAVSFVGMIMCAKKQHVNSVAKPAAIGLLFVVVICAVIILSHNMGGGDNETIIENEMKYVKSQTYVLGQELARQFPGAKVLFVIGRRNENNPRQNALIDGFKEGCSPGITDIVIDTPPVQIPKANGNVPASYEEMLGVEELMTAKDFNKMLAKHKDCKIIVTTVGLPQDAGNLKIWKMFEKNPEKCPKLVMVGGDVSKLAPFIKIGLVPDIVVYSPNAKYNDDAPPEKMKDAFDMRYLLITKDNLQEIIKKYPNRIFTKPR